MNKLQLSNVTLIAIAGNKQSETIASLYKSMKQVDFAKVKLITNRDISLSDIEVVNVGGLDTWQEYNRFCIKELSAHFDTDYVLIQQWDSWVLDSSCWDDKMLSYDYIGAKWFVHERPYTVGNGGFSIRSKRLQIVLATDDFIKEVTPEDNCISKFYRSYLEQKYGITYASEEIADKFSFELNPPLHPTFGFHGFHQEPFKETVLIKRDYALGDVVMIEPILRYFHKKGYRVALDTVQPFQELFMFHDFPVIPKQNLHPELKYKTIDLSGAYEIKPQQNHLESYYDFCGVSKEDRVIAKPKLNLQFDMKKYKIFKNYCIIHIDERAEAYRNIYGIDWEKIVSNLKKRGYLVLQLGLSNHKPIKGAVEMRTPGTPFLMWVCSGASFFIGIDSGISHICSAFNIPSVIFFGSVNPEIIHPTLENIIPVHKHHGEGVCTKPFCWHHVISESGTPCYIDNAKPPCTQFTTEEAMQHIEKVFLIVNKK